MFVKCFENLSGEFLIYRVLTFCSKIQTENFDNFINYSVYIYFCSGKTVCFVCSQYNNNIIVIIT